MRAVLQMWKHPLMIVLTAVCAALYACGLIVFRFPPPLNVRPIGQMLPMSLSLMFGPAGAWGTALGDLLHGFVVGQIELGTIFGFFGNFLLGYLPFTLWSRLRPLSNGSRSVTLTSFREWALFVLIAISSAAAAALAIAWPLHIVGVAPFAIVGPLILIQDGLFGAASAVLLLLIYRRVSAIGMLWWQILPEIDLDKPENPLAPVGAWIVVSAALGAVTIGLVVPASITIVGAIGIILVFAGAVLMY